jgi:hypothetical protein
VADAFGQQGRTRQDFESDVAVLRRVYARAPDHSIVFVAVGFLNSLEGLGWDAATNPIQLALELSRQRQPGLLADGLRRKAFDPAAVRFATDADGELFGFHHRGLWVEIREGRVQVDPAREGPFSILELRMPTAGHQARDYLDAILARLAPPLKP